MTIEQAITYARGVAEDARTDLEGFVECNEAGAFDTDIDECTREAEEYERLAEWLEELKAIKEYVDPLRSFDTHNMYLEELKKIVKKD